MKKWAIAISANDGFNLCYFGLAVLSGILMRLADFPAPVMPLMFVSIAPLIYVLYKSRTWPSFIYSLITFLLGSSGAYQIGGAQIPIPVIFGSGLGYCLLYAGLGALTSWLSKKLTKWLWIFIFPSGCVLIEALGVFAGVGFGGTAAASGPVAEIGWLLGISSLGGAYLVIFLVRLVPTAIGLVVAINDFRKVIVPVTLTSILILSAMVYGTYYYLGPKPLDGGMRGANGRIPPAWDRTVRVAAVVYAYPDEYYGAFRNAALNVKEETPPEHTWSVLKSYEKLIRRAALDKATIVATPEAGYFVPASMLNDVSSWLSDLAKELKITIVTGYIENKTRALTALIATPDGKTTTITKHDLVWGFERTTFNAGPNEPVVIDANGIKMSVKICYDADFPSAFRQMAQKGVDLTIVIASDWWFIAKQHYDQCLYRGVENGMALLRPTGGGVSAIVDPYGNTIIKGTPDKDRVTYIIADVPLKTTSGTPYTILGDWIVYLSAMFIVGGIVVRLLRNKENEKVEVK
jgi:apolipoprotein N-acyltransferase